MTASIKKAVEALTTEAPVEVPEEEILPKSPAPEVGVNLDTDDYLERTNQLARLNKDNPEFEHTYTHPDAKGSELRARGQEVVKGEDGEPLHHGGDPVVRQSKEMWDRKRKAEGKASRARVESVVKNPKSTVRRRPKDPVDAIID